jgi:hypothetical protein
MRDTVNGKTDAKPDISGVTQSGNGERPITELRHSARKPNNSHQYDKQNNPIFFFLCVQSSYM